MVRLFLGLHVVLWFHQCRFIGAPRYPHCVFTQSRYAGLDDVGGPSIEAVFESNWNGPEPRMMSQEICNLVCGYLLSPKNAALIPARMTRNRSC